MKFESETIDSDWESEQYPYGVINEKLHEEFSMASGTDFYNSMRGYLSDMYRFLPYLGHSKLGRDKWWYFRETFKKAAANPSGTTRNMKNNAESDKKTIVKEAEVGKKYIDNAYSYYKTMANYVADAKKFYDKAVSAKKRADESYDIRSSAKHNAHKKANNAIKKYGFLMDSWKEAQSRYKALRVDEIRKLASTKTSNISVLNTYVISYSTDADMRINSDRLKDLRNGMKNDKEELVKDSDAAEKDSNRTVGGGLWNTIKKLNPIAVGVRNLILLSIKLNIIDLGTKLNKLRLDGTKSNATDKEVDGWNKMKRSWMQWGGSVDNLEKAINEGKNKPIKKIKKGSSNFSNVEGEPQGGDKSGLTDEKVDNIQAAAIGVAGTATAATGGTAAPWAAGAAGALVTILEIMQEAGVFVKDEIEQAAADSGISTTNNDAKILGIPQTGFMVGAGILSLALLGTAVYYGTKK